MADLLSSGRDGPPRRSFGVAAGLALIVAVGVFLALRGGSDPDDRPAPAPTTTAASPTPSARPVVSRLGHPLWGITAHWELFGRNDNSVVRIEPARGRVTSTGVPFLQSSGPVSFLAGKNAAIIRPFDRVYGYSVADGKKARALTGLLGAEGPALDGPKPNTLWISDEGTMRLFTVDGRSLKKTIQLPRDIQGYPVSDQDGYLIYATESGYVDARPGGVRQITHGELLAAGPTRFLTRECPARGHCRLRVIDRMTGRHRDIGPDPGRQTLLDASAISPDGTAAAVIRTDRSGKHPVLHLLALDSGTDETIAVPLDPKALRTGTLAWSPDSRRLFVIARNGELDAVDPLTGSAAGLGLQLPPVVQLAIRTTAGA